ncbi:hypothetical protein ABTY61_37505 [Kitasatospora sp. NPDC096128]|uniref:hypothetical protein n=1 Tax=Kitasatospora sp. NPDC096128 TaxID=3155547 RepID=UPI00333073C7
MPATSSTPTDLYPVLSDTAELFADDPEFARLIRKAELLCHARSLKRWLKGNPIDIVFVLQNGKDLGLTTYESLNAFYPDETEESGLGLHASAKRALMHRAGWGWRIVETTPERCTVALTDPDKPDHGELTETYTIQDARLAELLDGPNASYWRRYPRQMLYARVTSLAFEAHVRHTLWAGPRILGTPLAADPAPMTGTTVPNPTPEHTASHRPPAPAPFHDPAPAPDLGDEPPMSEPDTPNSPLQPGRAHPHPIPTTPPAPAAQVPRPAAEPTPAPVPPKNTTNTEPGQAADPAPATPAPEPADTSPPPATTPPATAEPEGALPNTEPDQPDQDDRQHAWAQLRRHSQGLKEIAIYRILDGDEKRTAKEIAAGSITTDGVAALRAAHKAVGLTPDTVYRTLLKHKVPPVTEPGPVSSTPLQTAPRPEMPVIEADRPAGEGTASP